MVFQNICIQYYALSVKNDLHINGLTRICGYIYDILALEYVTFDFSFRLYDAHLKLIHRRGNIYITCKHFADALLLYPTVILCLQSNKTND